jgi:DNA-binding CsgD family transcriptional regulator
MTADEARGAVKAAAAFAHSVPMPLDRTVAPRGRYDRRRLMSAVLEWVTSIVPTTVAVFHTVDERLRVTAPVVIALAGSRRVDGAHPECVAEGYDARAPFALARYGPTGATVVGVDELGGWPAFCDTPYASQLHSRGIATQTTLYLRDDVRVIGVIALLHSVDRPHLTPDERASLARSHRLIEEAYGLAHARASIDERVSRFNGSGLSAREVEVAVLAGSGASNEEIARALTVSLATVKTHLHRAFTKLGIRSRTQLALLLTGGSGELSRDRREACG